jgi:hypothetical protein
MLPLSNFQTAKAAFVPAIIMILLRPAVFVLLLLLTFALGCGTWYLLLHVFHLLHR